MKISVLKETLETSYDFTEAYEQLFVDLNTTDISRCENFEVFIHTGDSSGVYTEGEMYIIRNDMHKFSKYEDSDTEVVYIDPDIYPHIDDLPVGGTLPIALRGVAIKRTDGIIPADTADDIIGITAKRISAITVAIYVISKNDRTTESAAYGYYKGVATESVVISFTNATNEEYNAANVKLTEESISNVMLPSDASFNEFMTKANNNGIPYDVSIRYGDAETNPTTGNPWYPIMYRVTAYTDLNKGIHRLFFSQGLTVNGNVVNYVDIPASDFDVNGVAVVVAYYDGAFDNIFDVVASMAHYNFSVAKSDYDSNVYIYFGDTDYSSIEFDKTAAHYMRASDDNRHIKFAFNSATAKYVSVLLDGEGFADLLTDKVYKITIRSNGRDVTSCFNIVKTTNSIKICRPYKASSEKDEVIDIELKYLPYGFDTDIQAIGLDDFMYTLPEEGVVMTPYHFYFVNEDNVPESKKHDYTVINAFSGAAYKYDEDNEEAPGTFGKLRPIL